MPSYILSSRQIIPGSRLTGIENRVTARKNRAYLKPILGKVEPYFKQAAAVEVLATPERSRVIKKESERNCNES
jgi:hypothetical protein